VCVWECVRVCMCVCVHACVCATIYDFETSAVRWSRLEYVAAPQEKGR